MTDRLQPGSPSSRLVPASQAARNYGASLASPWRWRQPITIGSQALRLDLVPGRLTRTPKMARLETALFVADGAMTARRLAQVATLADAREAAALIEQLNADYDARRSAFRIENVAGGYQLLTRADLAPWLDRIHHRQSQLSLSAPALETLALIAYRQPCTRADVEAVRGVQSAEIIKQLMERSLVRVVGEDDSLGRPYLYGTTRRFLETFGLTALEGLPMAESLRHPAVDLKKSSEPEEAEPSAESSDAAETSSSDEAAA